MPNRFFLFYTESEIEAKRWVRVLNLVARMRKMGIPLFCVSPFDFEKYLIERNELDAFSASLANETMNPDGKKPPEQFDRLLQNLDQNVQPVVKQGQLPTREEKS